MKITFTLFSFTIENDKGNGGKSFTSTSWGRIKKLVKKRSNSICHYCGKFASRGHVDHVVPLSRGGSDDLSNLVWACRACNLSKHDKTPDEWMADDITDMPGDLDNENTLAFCWQAPALNKNGLAQFCKAILEGQATFSERGSRTSTSEGKLGAVHFGYTGPEYIRLRATGLELGYIKGRRSRNFLTKAGVAKMLSIILYVLGEDAIPEQYDRESQDSQQLELPEQKSAEEAKSLPGADDFLLEEAIEIARQQGKASSTMLQRHLRIGYARASRIITVMEERGIIGPMEKANEPRRVIEVERDENGDV